MSLSKIKFTDSFINKIFPILPTSDLFAACAALDKNLVTIRKAVLTRNPKIIYDSKGLWDSHIRSYHTEDKCDFIVKCIDVLRLVQKPLLAKLQFGHRGRDVTLEYAYDSMWWPCMVNSITHRARLCEDSCKISKNSKLSIPFKRHLTPLNPCLPTIKKFN